MKNAVTFAPSVVTAWMGNAHLRSATPAVATFQLDIAPPALLRFHGGFPRAQFAARRASRDALDDVSESRKVMGDSRVRDSGSRQGAGDPHKEVSDLHKAISDPHKEISDPHRVLSDPRVAREATVVTSGDATRAGARSVTAMSEAGGLERVALNTMSEAVAVTRAP